MGSGTETCACPVFWVDLCVVVGLWAGEETRVDQSVDFEVWTNAIMPNHTTNTDDQPPQPPTRSTCVTCRNPAALASTSDGSRSSSSSSSPTPPDPRSIRRRPPKRPEAPSPSPEGGCTTASSAWRRLCFVVGWGAVWEVVEVGAARFFKKGGTGKGGRENRRDVRGWGRRRSRLGDSA